MEQQMSQRLNTENVKNWRKQKSLKIEITTNRHYQNVDLGLKFPMEALKLQKRPSRTKKSRKIRKNLVVFVLRLATGLILAAMSYHLKKVRHRRFRLLIQETTQARSPYMFSLLLKLFFASPDAIQSNSEAHLVKGSERVSLQRTSNRRGYHRRVFWQA